jgi:hypothetical protein
MVMADAARSVAGVLGLLAKGAVGVSALALAVGLVAGPGEPVERESEVGSPTQVTLKENQDWSASHVRLVDPTGREVVTVTRFPNRSLAVTVGPEVPRETPVCLSRRGKASLEVWKHDGMTVVEVDADGTWRSTRQDFLRSPDGLNGR